MAVKTDMSKAYDRLEWSFIKAVFERLGFSAIWVNWIMQCISTVSYSFLINDTAREMVVPDRGIRQGDPLSPYIFILCGEVLSGLCCRAQNSGDLTRIRVARRCPRLTHLLFADDTMFFIKATTSNASTLHAILHQYELASGQLINTDKSSISFSAKTPQETRISVKQTLGIAKEGGVGKYLGLPELFTRKKRDLFSSIVERIKIKAASWSSRRLSAAGKLTMLKSVLTATPTYSMSCFLLPVGLCNSIQSALTRFWWDADPSTRKICWVSWDTLSTSKDSCGLGFRDIQAFNIAMLGKLAWRLVTKPDCLLARTLLGKYCYKGSFLTVPCPSSTSHGWRGIIAGRDLLIRHLRKVIGNGNSTKVWSDSWLSSSEDMRILGPPREIDRDLVVADLMIRGSNEWNHTKIEATCPQVAHLIYLIRPSAHNMEDIFCWHGSKDGIYSVRSGYYSLIEDTRGQAHQLLMAPFNWSKAIWAVDTSPKLKLFLWKLAQGALPLGANLQARGMMSNTNCPHCGGIETGVHLIFECPFAQQVWALAPIKPNLDFISSASVHSALTAASRLVCLPPSGIASDFFSWLCWNIWTARNRLLFENRTSPAISIVTNALCNAREWMLGQEKKPDSPPPASPYLPAISFPPETALCNSDAAWTTTTKRAGLGWILGSTTTTPQVSGSSASPFVSSPLLAEALALREAIRAAHAANLPNVWMRSDSQVLVRAVNSKKFPMELYGVLMDIEYLFSRFMFFLLSFIPREQNSAADSLAKSALCIEPATLRV
ncbi:uncharacterized protein LOC125596828 [Brassica napus]|uniref:uncharacterized protein LOC106403361 n=1 Tax=Brassica napus TaxID=3708 RepID=UPI002078F43C|nr:uncharacterized protein LOC106403361 [Brassica napus]XP_048627804.1 uncharacterized protein LOC125596828 [Brassica napus]